MELQKYIDFCRITYYYNNNTNQKNQYPAIFLSSNLTSCMFPHIVKSTLHMHNVKNVEKE